MNRKKLESEISIAYLYNDSKKIQDIYIDLVNARAKLDRWFNKYLDMFDEKMSNCTRADPIWKLYHEKSDEYSEVVRTIKTAEYYIKKA
jgi:hypothetical protein